MFKNLGEFLRALDKAGEIKYINDEVSPYLEISRYTDHESKSPEGGKALYFKKVRGFAFPVVTNIFGSPKRITTALGVENLDELGRRIKEYIEFNPPTSIKDALSALPLAVGLATFFPRNFKGRRPPCQEVVLKGDQVDLCKLPVLHCWPKDGGPFITLPLVITRSLENGRRNVGMYRLQVFDKNTTGMHWHIHKDGSHYYGEYRKAGKRMPVAVAIGADPAVTYAATAPMPRGIDEMILAGFIRKKPVQMAKCVTIDLEVPAEAEFVLEGYVDPNELRLEGPFGDHTGYYSLADMYPVFHVTAITHRRNPVYNATLVGRPPMEDCYLAKATERMFLPLLQTVMPEIHDYCLPWEGVFHNIVVVSIQKEYPGHAHKVISGLWGQGQMSFCKAIVIVDRDVNPQDGEQVFRALVRNFDIATDIVLSKGVLDVLDHSSPFANFGNKIGIDLTERFPGEPPRNANASASKTPSQYIMEETESALKADVEGVVSCKRLFADLFGGTAVPGDAANSVLAVRVEKGEGRGGAYFAKKILDLNLCEGFNLILLYDAAVDLNEPSLMLWKLFNNTDPGRDITVRERRAVIDACKKGPMDGHEREWPDELTFDEN